MTHMTDQRHALSLPQPVHVLNVPIHPVSPNVLIDAMVRRAAMPGRFRVYNVNVHAMNLAHRLPDFAQALANADLVFCDGYGVKWGAGLLGVDLPHRMTPPDWIDAFAAACGRSRQSVYALGDEPGIASRFQAALAARHPGYIDAGSHHGFFDKTGRANDCVIEQINDSGAAHLLVGFGMPLQERWIEANLHRLRPRIYLPVGALFRWYVREERRAPKWMTDHGMEWLARLACHPLRHLRRYVVGNPAFFARVLRERAMNGRASLTAASVDADSACRTSAHASSGVHPSERH